MAQNLVAAAFLAHFERQDHLAILFRAAQAIDARDRGHDQHIAPLEQAARGREAQLLDLLVEHTLFLDVGIGARNVGFWLVIIVVGDKILDSVVGKELLVLAVKLRRQRLIGRKHQRGFLHLLDDLGDGVGLAAARHPQQRLFLIALLNAVHQLRNRLRLISRWREWGVHFEFWHALSL